MYQKAYGIIETLAPLHVGASAGEETGNLNLIFRDQFTQAGIIPGSSIRGRFRADMRSQGARKEQDWYGREAVKRTEATGEDDGTTEALVKFEYASLVWLPVFCPGQPIIWVTCPRLLQRYKQLTGIDAEDPAPYTAPPSLQGRQIGSDRKALFFNLGFLEVEHEVDLAPWVPEGVGIRLDSLVVVDNNDMSMIHDMALYRQSRVKLADDQKKVDGGAFFNVEALPEGSVLIFPIAIKQQKQQEKKEQQEQKDPEQWKPFGNKKPQELYFGGLESIGFGRCNVTLNGAFQ